LQKEKSKNHPEKGEVWKLPGGWMDTSRDDSTLRTLRREIGEEWGEEGMELLAKGLIQTFPLDSSVSMTEGENCQSPLDCTYQRGYIIDGNQIGDTPNLPNKINEILEFKWVDISEADDILKMPGYRSILKKYRQETNELPSSLNSSAVVYERL
jgi:8-oxo-dGTP pyrophosphatase MutT (NUDIX family)